MVSVMYTSLNNWRNIFKSKVVENLEAITTNAEVNRKEKEMLKEPL
jgi:hypothetical protein